MKTPLKKIRDAPQTAEKANPPCTTMIEVGV